MLYEVITLLGGFDQQVEEHRVDVGTTGDHRPATDLVIADFALVDTRGVGSETYIV